MAPAHPVGVDYGDHLEHEVVPEVLCLEAVQSQQLLHEPDERPLPSDFTRVHPGANQALLFVLEQPRVVVRQVAALSVEVFAFIVHVLPGSDCDALHIPALVGLAECHAVKIDTGMVAVSFIQSI